MIPFLAKNKQAGQTGLSVKERQPDTHQENSQGAEKIEICAMELILAVKKNDVKGAAEATYNAWCILEDSEESPESPKTDFHTQNALAGKESY